MHSNMHFVFVSTKSLKTKNFRRTLPNLVKIMILTKCPQYSFSTFGKRHNKTFNCSKANKAESGDFPQGYLKG